MITCPQDNMELMCNNYSYYCPKCDFKFNSNDIAIFHPDIDVNHGDYHASGLDTLYKAEQNHFWFKQRREVIYSAFEKYVDKSAKCIEIGAGTGSISRFMLEKGYNVSVGEIHKSGLEYAGSYGIEERYQFDLLKSPFKNHFNVIGMFDVLEHIEDEELALINMRQMLTEDGIVIITVPAHMWLWNREDAIAGHKRRYSNRNLYNLFSSNEFEVIECKNFFTSIIPLLYIRRLINKDHGLTINDNEFNQGIHINPIVNSALNTLLSIEKKVMKNSNLPIGGSILLVAKKI